MIYGYTFLDNDTLSSINEGVLTHNEDTKKFRSGLKELLDDIKSRTSGFEKLGKLGKKYNDQYRSEVIKFINSNTDKYYTSTVMTIVTTSNGVEVGKNYLEYFTCVIKDTIIYFAVQYFSTKVSLYGSMSDYDINKYNIPRDIIEYCIDNAPKNLKLTFGKNFVSLNSPYDAINALKTSFPKQLKQYVESKHSDYEVDIPKVLSRKIKIKKK